MWIELCRSRGGHEAIGAELPLGVGASASARAGSPPAARHAGGGEWPVQGQDGEIADRPS